MSYNKVRHWPQGYKTFFKLNLAEHEIFSASKYENANFVGIFIFISIENFVLWQTEQDNNWQLYLSVICCLLVGKISCSAELSMEKV